MSQGIVFHMIFNRFDTWRNKSVPICTKINYNIINTLGRIKTHFICPDSVFFMYMSFVQSLTLFNSQHLYFVVLDFFKKSLSR